jgi:hypothetical protein
MTLEQPENKIDTDTFIREIKVMTPKQLSAWIKDFRDNQLLIKVEDGLKKEIEGLSTGQDKTELGRKLWRIRERIKKNISILKVDKSLRAGGLLGKKTEYNI